MFNVFFCRQNKLKIIYKNSFKLLSEKRISLSKTKKELLFTVTLSQ